MNGLRIGITFVIVLVIFLLSMYQMQLRGYEKIGRFEEWNIYYKDEGECENQAEAIYSDETYNYFYGCGDEESLMAKRGFEEYSLTFALENGYLEIFDIEESIDITRSLIE